MADLRPALAARSLAVEDRRERLREFRRLLHIARGVRSSALKKAGLLRKVRGILNAAR